MVITFSVGGSAGGPRPIDPNRDFPQLARLLKAVFHDDLERSGQQAFDNAALPGTPPVLWRLDPFFARLTPGFVWEEDGRIVGNVTILPTKQPRRYIVANVAIDEAYRRRGIARALMETVQKDALSRGAAEIRLQVNHDNDSAKNLYQSLGYSAIGTVTTWNLMGSRGVTADEMYPIDGRIHITELPRSRWQEAYDLDQATPQADLYWPDPLPKDEYRSTLLRRLKDFLSGRHFEAWVTADSGGPLLGLATINSEWGRAHLLRVRVHPDRQGELENALLHKLMRRLQLLPRRQVRLLHDADDQTMNALLPSLHFRRGRTLTQMRLALD